MWSRKKSGQNQGMLEDTSRRSCIRYSGLYTEAAVDEKVQHGHPGCSVAGATPPPCCQMAEEAARRQRWRAPTFSTARGISSTFRVRDIRGVGVRTAASTRPPLNGYHDSPPAAGGRRILDW